MKFDLLQISVTVSQPSVPQFISILEKNATQFIINKVTEFPIADGVQKIDWNRMIQLENIILCQLLKS